MNTTGTYFNLCSIKLQQKINALASSFDAILAEAAEEDVRYVQYIRDKKDKSN
ncbi:hypothetical protein BC941DRAFT_473895 [Chlamydoabsidia padenii]|nr:hypothetical protein BC941DRAFT_473895 [Chlamydoabsidia padenii]